jgi:acyl carrier protein
VDSKISELRTWLESLHDEPIEIQDDTDLIESGTVTSLQFVQMVIEVERIHGRKLDPGVINIVSMRTLKAIDATVFQVA